MNSSRASQGSPAISSPGTLQLFYPRQPQNVILQPAGMIRKVVTPYEEIPWPYDMYLQPVSHQLTPQRLRIDVFENGVQDFYRQHYVHRIAD